MNSIFRFFVNALVFAFVFVPAIVHAEIHYYTEGHADLGLGDGDELELHVHTHNGAIVDGIEVNDPSGGLEFAPTDVVIVVPESTKNYARSQGGATAEIASHLGLSMGSDCWFLPETNTGEGGAAELHSPFFGLGAEDVYAGVFDDNQLKLSLFSMSGPVGGQVAVGTYDNGWYISTADGISPDADKIDNIPVGVHAHLNWFFSQPGTYQLTFQASAAVGGEARANESTYTFQVVPEPGAIALLASATMAGAVLMFRKRKSNV
jgi:surface-anchored protein